MWSRCLCNDKRCDSEILKITIKVISHLVLNNCGKSVVEDSQDSPVCPSGEKNM